MRILLVEDEPRLASMLDRLLTDEGHGVDRVGVGEDALDWAATVDYDAVVLDVMLPGIDGFEVCRRMRQRGDRAPVLLLTARDAVADRVAGLDAGADDYLVKPFAFAELAARLRALGRRPAEPLPAVLRAGPIRLDPAERRVWYDDAAIDLPNKEFRILELLMRNPGRVMTRLLIAERVWDHDFPGVSNVIDVHVRQLRRRLGDPVPGGVIETVRGAGYRIRGDR